MSSKRSSFLSFISKAFIVLAAATLVCGDLAGKQRVRRSRRWLKKRAVYSHALMNMTEAPFSKTYAKIFSDSHSFTPSRIVASNDELIVAEHHLNENDDLSVNAKNTLVWEEHNIDPFEEAVFSWNARRRKGKFTIYVAIEHSAGKAVWHRLAEWGAKGQKTFGKKAPFVLTSYSRVHMRGDIKGKGFRVKVVAEDGANIKDMHALFVCTSNFKKYRRPGFNIDMPSVVINNVPRQSQFRLDHPRYKDLCAPTSTSMIVRYFSQKQGEVSRLPSLHHSAALFADKVYDKSLNIYGNWILNVAQAYDASDGNVFFRAERLHGPKHLHSYLMKQIPVAVSVRGWIPGAAHVYRNGHFIVIVGWNNETKRFICIDPAFRVTKKLLTSYSAKDFLAAWRRSLHMAYIPIPRNVFGFPQTTPGLTQEAERLRAEREDQPILEPAPIANPLTARAEFEALAERGIVV